MAELNQSKNKSPKGMGKETNSLLLTKEKILENKRNNLKLVEMMLEESVSEQWLLSACEKLCQDEYTDAVEERNILNLCGYPLCSKNIKVARHKYHISTKLNKVYDITERKCFCSNECYKASKFLKLQLSTIPILVEKEDPVTISLISSEANGGCRGEEIDIGATRLSEDIIENDDVEKIENILLNDAASQLRKEIDVFSYDVDNLEVKEQYQYGTNETIDGKCENHFKRDESLPSSSTSLKQHILTKKVKSKSSDNDDDALDSTNFKEDGDDKKFFMDYENPGNLSNKYMPVHSEKRNPRTVLINSLKGPSETYTSVPIFKHLESIQNILQEWVSEDTIKILFGEEHLESLKKDFSENALIFNERRVDVLKHQEDYAKLCVKLDRMDIEEAALEKSIMKDNINEIKCVKEQDVAPAENGDMSLENKASLFYQGEVPHADCSQPKEKPVKKKGGKGQTKRNVEGKKHVKFSTILKDLPPIASESKSDAPEMDIVLPFVDSLSQNAMRRQVVTNKLKKVYLDLLPWINIHYKDICDFLRELIGSFRLSAKNITLRPSETKIIAIVLLRMLKGKLKDSLCDDTTFSTLLKKAHIGTELSIVDIDNLLKNILYIAQ